MRKRSRRRRSSGKRGVRRHRRRSNPFGVKPLAAVAAIGGAFVGFQLAQKFLLPMMPASVLQSPIAAGVVTYSAMALPTVAAYQLAGG